MHKIQFLQSQNGCVLFFVCRVSLGERLQHEESSGVIRSTGSSSGEKEITFQVEKVKKKTSIERYWFNQLLYGFS